jgi:AbrB family looped-hinge helix DNA binding protein
MYLTGMTKHTKVSAKGQVVIPKDVRDRLHWAPGTELEVVDGPAGVMLRAKPPERKKLPFDEALAQLRAIVNYKGPKITDEDAKAGIDEMFRNDPQWDLPKR